MSYDATQFTIVTNRVIVRCDEEGCGRFEMRESVGPLWEEPEPGWSAFSMRMELLERGWAFDASVPPSGRDWCPDHTLQKRLQ